MTSTYECIKECRARLRFPGEVGSTQVTVGVGLRVKLAFREAKRVSARLALDESVLAFIPVDVFDNCFRGVHPACRSSKG